MRNFRKLISLLLAVLLILPVGTLSFTATASSDSIKVGDTITLGTYTQSAIKDSDGNVTDYKTEPIEWIVLNITDGKALLLSKKIIDGRAYNHTSSTVDGYYGNNYAHSDIRKWLIGDFYNTAFTSAEQNAIVPTELDNSATSNRYSSESTTDNVFLLSKWEAQTYANKYYSTTATDYAYSNGFTARTSTESCNQWRLRTAGSNYYELWKVEIRWGSWTVYYNWYDDEITPISGIRPALNLDLEKYEEINYGKFLNGYDTSLDQYIFSNQTSEISYLHYLKMFPPITSYLLHKEYDGTRGQCYGMAATTALFLQNNPSPTSAKLLKNEDKYATHIKDMWNEDSVEGILEDSFISKYQINLSDFIKYAHIYQNLPQIGIERDINFNKYEKIVNAIKDYIDGGEPIIIGIRGDIDTKTDCGHALLPIGIKEADSSYIVYVNDSNNPYSLQELIFKKENNTITGWSYETLDWGSDKPNGKIYYSTPCNEITFFCQMNAINEDIQNFFEDNYKLVTTNNENALTKTDNIIEILTENGTSNDNFLYWVDESIETSTFSAVDKDTELSYCDNNVGISAKIPQGATAECIADDDKLSSITITNAQENEIEVSFMTSSENGIIFATITGSATTDEVLITQTENGIAFSGLNNSTITISENDEIKFTEEITCSTGENEINYDKANTENTISIKYIKSHSDLDKNGYCDICGKDMTENCKCICHSKNIFVQFVWEILCAVFRFLKIDAVRYCDCGAAHW